MPRNRKFEGVVSTDSTPMTRQVDWRGLSNRHILLDNPNMERNNEINSKYGIA